MSMRLRSGRSKARWTSRIHFENRNGLIAYCATLTNGRLVATLRGGFSRLPVAADHLQSAAAEAVTNWLAHPRDGGFSKPKIKKLHYVRAHCHPVNRNHKEHRQGRRAA